MSLDETLTVCLPTHNSLCTIRIVLQGLSMQAVRPLTLVLDNGSRDGTRQAVSTMIRNKWFPNLNLKLETINELSGHASKNIPFVRHKLTDMCKTNFLMFLDSDVLLPPIILQPMIQQMIDNPKLGMLGLLYDPHTNHVKLGATMIRTYLIKDHKWRLEPGKCECVEVSRFIASQGYSVEHFPDQTARHMRYF